jgi:hypothetical protein
VSSIGEFSVWEHYPDGTHSAVARYIDAKDAVDIAHRTTQKPAVLLGVIVKVTITDGGDHCAFLWEHDKGIIYPTPAQRYAHAAMKEDE